jgi:hypothetical protein
LFREGIALRAATHFVLAFSLGLFWSAVAGASAERRVALVIGNSAYVHAGRLSNPANDAADLDAALRRLNFDVILLTDVNGMTLDQAATAFLTKAKDADVAMFFFAGHGLQHDGGAYLIPVDASLGNEFAVRRETFSVQQFVKALEGAAKVSIVALDACRNNPMAEMLRRSLLTRERNRAVGYGLGRIETGLGNMLVVYSAAPGQEAVDGDSRNSPFTAALLKHIETPGLEVEQMLKRVTAEVDEKTNHKQQPERLSRLKVELRLKPGAMSDEASVRLADIERREVDLKRREDDLKRRQASLTHPQNLTRVQNVARPHELTSPPAQSVTIANAHAGPTLVVNKQESAGWGLKRRVWVDGALAVSAVNASRTLFAVGGDLDGVIHVFDTSFMTERFKFQIPQYKLNTLNDIFIPGNGQVIGVVRNGSLELYTPANGALVGRIAAKPNFETGRVRISKYGKFIYFIQSSTKQKKSVLTALELHETIFHLVDEIVFDSQITSLDVSPDDNLLVMAVNPQNEIRLYDRTKKKTVWSVQCDCSVKFNADASTALFAGRFGAIAGNASKSSRIGMINVSNPRELRAYDSKSEDALEVTDLSPDGSLFLVTSAKGQVRVMPVPQEASAGFTPIKELSDDSGKSMSGAFFMRDAEAVASASTDNSVRFWGGMQPPPP